MPAYPGTTGRSYTMAEIVELLEAAGCPKDWTLTLAAIPWFEAGGLSNNLNNNPDTHDFSVGLWQINYFGNLFVAREAAYGPPQRLASDPAAQARAAVSILGGGPGISAWYGDAIGSAAQAGPLTWPRIKDIFVEHGVPPSWYAGVEPTPPPPAPPPHPPESKEKTLQVTFDAQGNQYVAAASANPASLNHLQIFKLEAGKPPAEWSVTDVTDEIAKANPGTGPYPVQP